MQLQRVASRAAFACSGRNAGRPGGLTLAGLLLDPLHQVQLAGGGLLLPLLRCGLQHNAVPQRRQRRQRGSGRQEELAGGMQLPRLLLRENERGQVAAAGEEDDARVRAPRDELVRLARARTSTSFFGDQARTQAARMRCPARRLTLTIALAVR